jgi:hypothetical protein
MQRDLERHDDVAENQGFLEVSAEQRQELEQWA